MSGNLAESQFLPSGETHEQNVSITTGLKPFDYKRGTFVCKIGNKIELFPLNHNILGRQKIHNSTKNEKKIIISIKNMSRLFATGKTPKFSLNLRNLHSDEFGHNC